ncbi:MAG: hypothetical protein E6Q97_06565 [Desulfurellales bacterium]|nr:MAG: hypothetical protein E6Q97_06565 [Desulfurellales bacterium]
MRVCLVSFKKSLWGGIRSFHEHFKTIEGFDVVEWKSGTRHKIPRIGIDLYVCTGIDPSAPGEWQGELDWVASQKNSCLIVHDCRSVNAEDPKVLKWIMNARDRIELMKQFPRWISTAPCVAKFISKTFKRDTQVIPIPYRINTDERRVRSQKAICVSQLGAQKGGNLLKGLQTHFTYYTSLEAPESRFGLHHFSAKAAVMRDRPRHYAHSETVLTMSEYEYLICPTKFKFCYDRAEYATLEAWNAGTIPIVWHEWIGDEVLIDGWTCYGVSSTQQIDAVLSLEYQPLIAERGFGLLSRYSPENWRSL